MPIHGTSPQPLLSVSISDSFSGGFLEGGSETTSLTMNNCIVGMLSNPSVIQKAHEELDRVVGSSRTPTFEDEPNLPYLRQIIKETLRWRPINKLGANHYATQDDWYEGFFIPKGSIVMVNWWALHYDEKRWRDPEKFDPDRMEGKTMSAAEEAASGDPMDRSHFSYGGGRRICPGTFPRSNPPIPFPFSLPRSTSLFISPTFPEFL